MPEPKWNGLKTIYVALVVSAFISLAMCGVTLRRMIVQFSHRASGQEDSAPSRPSPFRGSGAQGIATAAQAAAFRSFIYLAGTWQGTGISHDACNLRFEIRPKPESTFAGYVTLTCVPLSQTQNPNPVSMAIQRSPRAAILTGIPGNGEVLFHVEKLIGASEACPLTGLTAMQFGATQLAVEWTNNGCPGGQMVLSKVGP